MVSEIIVGIYKIISPSEKVYIGQSVNILHRFNTYTRMYSKNQHQTKLHRSFVKYGVDSHKFEIIETCSELDLNEKERYWQDYYEVLTKGLNCKLTNTHDKSGKVCEDTLKKMSEASKGNQHWKDKKHTEETKEKIRLSKIGLKYSDEVNKKKGRKGTIPPSKGKFSKDNPRSKPFNQYTPDKVFIKRWDCLMDVKRELKLNIGNISSCLNGKLKTSNGFIWNYN